MSLIGLTGEGGLAAGVCACVLEQAIKVRQASIREDKKIGHCRLSELNMSQILFIFY
jgi:hypothetical protein